MSHDIEDLYVIYDETDVKARKAHECCACKERIRPGDLYVRVFILDSDKTVESLKRCARCQAIHLHLRSLAPGDTWPAERLDCGESYADHWGGEPPPDIAALAFALPGETGLGKR